MTALVVAALVASSILMGRRGSAHRLAHLLAAEAAPRAMPAGPPRAGLGAMAGILGALGIAVAVGGATGAVAGAAAVSAVGLLARRDATSGERADAASVERSLPMACDLLSACIVAGAAPGAALCEVAAAVPGRLGVMLAEVARGLRLGMSMPDAWAPVVATGTPALRTLASALARATESGASPARTLDAMAVELREKRRLAGEAAARRAGVAMVAPLGICFLPAFVVVGVVPFVAGLMGTLDLGG
ncbi:MAG TPA: type II secretion system F family protein [Mycobacteriales bacterium]|nr:type II secretion system F family protein [Mycobacteriales bacterium]